MIKLEFMTEDDANHGALYLQDRGYSVKLMGMAIIVSSPDMADLSVLMVTYRAFSVDLQPGDEI